MTFGIRQVVGVLKVHNAKGWNGLMGFDSHWSEFATTLYNVTIGCHLGHLLDFGVALICYFYLMPITMPFAATIDLSFGSWIWKVIAFNLAVEFTFYTFWHWMTYSGRKILFCLFDLLNFSS